MLVQDVAAASAAFGPYVRPIAGDVGDAAALRRALRGTASVIVPGRLGALPQVARAVGLQRIVLLSLAGALAMLK